MAVPADFLDKLSEKLAQARGYDKPLIVVPDDLAAGSGDVFFLGNRQFLCLKQSVAEAIYHDRFGGLDHGGVVDPRVFRQALKEHEGPYRGEGSAAWNKVAMAGGAAGAVAPFLAAAKAVIDQKAIGEEALRLNAALQEVVTFIASSTPTLDSYPLEGMTLLVNAGAVAQFPPNSGVDLLHPTAGTVAKLHDILHISEAGTSRMAEHMGRDALYHTADQWRPADQILFGGAVLAMAAMAAAYIAPREHTIREGNKLSHLLRGAENSREHFTTPLLEGVMVQDVDKVNAFLTDSNRDNGRWAINRIQGLEKGDVRVADQNLPESAVLTEAPVQGQGY